jgi:hypothetical protein
VIGSYAFTILVVTGSLTFGAIAMTAAPKLLLRLVFGVGAPDATTVTLARHWGLLVALVGCLLVYSAYHADVRVPVMIAAVVEKLVGAVMFTTTLPRRPIIFVIAGVDTVMAALYLALLIVPG